jgi:HNH endonuclease
MAAAQRGKKRSVESRLKQAASLRAAGRRGAASHAWKGGRKKQHGYVKVLVGREHPMSDHHGYVLEHRLVMAQHLGRMLTREEVVHHVNEVRDDNRIENLMLFATDAEHRAHHLALRRAA